MVHTISCPEDEVQVGLFFGHGLEDAGIGMAGQVASTYHPPVTGRGVGGGGAVADQTAAGGSFTLTIRIL